MRTRACSLHIHAYIIMRRRSYSEHKYISWASFEWSNRSSHTQTRPYSHPLAQQPTGWQHIKSDSRHAGDHTLESFYMCVLKNTNFTRNICNMQLLELLFCCVRFCIWRRIFIIAPDERNVSPKSVSSHFAQANIRFSLSDAINSVFDDVVAHVLLKDTARMEYYLMLKHNTFAAIYSEPGMPEHEWMVWCDEQIVVGW